VSTNPESIRITETPRDAMQGMTRHIPAAVKAEYISQLLRCGFDVLDAGSFVSAKAVPQMADTSEVLSLLDAEASSSLVMVLTGNIRGGLQAAGEERVDIIGYPYSVSETFLKKNLNTHPEAALRTVSELAEICRKSEKKLRIYVAMAFGNPFGDPWDESRVLETVQILTDAVARDIRILDLVFSDITGEGSPDRIGRLCEKLQRSFPGLDAGVHLHTAPGEWQPKVEAVWDAGIRRFESALGGYGGCPMTGYELLANLDTLSLSEWCSGKGIVTGLDPDAIQLSAEMARRIFQ
jgi:hydroxymethylglutaryl-CoA lyase